MSSLERVNHPEKNADFFWVHPKKRQNGSPHRSAPMADKRIPSAPSAFSCSPLPSSFHRSGRGAGSEGASTRSCAHSATGVSCHFFFIWRCQAFSDRIRLSRLNFDNARADKKSNIPAARRLRPVQKMFKARGQGPDASPESTLLAHPSFPTWGRDSKQRLRLRPSFRNPPSGHSSAFPDTPRDFPARHAADSGRPQEFPDGMTRGKFHGALRPGHLGRMNWILDFRFWILDSGIGWGFSTAKRSRHAGSKAVRPAADLRLPVRARRQTPLIQNRQSKIQNLKSKIDSTGA